MIHEATKYYARDMQIARRYGIRELEPHRQFGGDNAAYRTMLERMIDMAVLDAMTFHQRPSGGQII